MQIEMVLKDWFNDEDICVEDCSVCLAGLSPTENLFWILKWRDYEHRR